MKDQDNIDKLIESASHLQVPKGRSKEEAWNLLQEKIKMEKPRAKTLKLYPYLPIGMAAAVALFVVVYFFILTDKTITSPRGQHFSFSLPDASTIILNAESEAQFNPRNWENNRQLKLKGEAFFEVKPGSSFIVETRLGNVQVVGTSFNVNNRDAFFEVSCFSGSVQVSDITGNHVTLKAGELVQLQNNNLSPSSPIDAKTASWRTGEFYFDNAEFKYVVEELERQFNIEIEMKTDSDRMYTGYFTTKNLDEALKLVFAPMELQYTIDNKKIIVR